MHNLDKIRASLSGYTLLITGGGSGIGYSTAKLFAKMGANVAVNYLPEDIESKNRVNELKDKYINIIEVTGDVSQEKIAKRVIFETIKKFNSLNSLTNALNLVRLCMYIFFGLSLFGAVLSQGRSDSWLKASAGS